MASTIWTVVIAILVFGAIIFFHELGHFTVAKLSGVKVEEFAIGMGPVLFRKEKNGTRYSLRALPVGGFVAMEGEEEEVNSRDSFSSQPWYKQLAVIVAGSGANLVMGYILLVILVIMTGYVGTTTVARFGENSVSQGILQVGDKITHINGHWVTTANDITYEFQRDRDGLIELRVDRGGEKIDLPPIQFPMTDLGDGVSAISIDFKVQATKNTVGDVILYPLNWGYSIVRQVWGSLIDLLTGRYTINQLSGPVGVATVIGEASRLGADAFLNIAAFITINIGVFNLLPFPILDGGKVVQILVEAVTRRKVPARVINAINMVGFFLLIGLMVYVTFNDIGKLIFR